MTTLVAAGLNDSSDASAFTSTNDGVSWSSVSTVFDLGIAECVAGLPALFVMGGLSADGTVAILTSPSGSAWSSVYTPYANGAGNGGTVAALCWNGSILVAGGVPNSTQPSPGQAIMTSPDGTTWTARTSPWDSDSNGEQVSAIVWTGSQFVAGGASFPGDASNRCIMTSSNGITWTNRTTPWDGGSGDSAVSGLAWSGSLLVAVGQQSGGSDDVVMTSPDGVTWTTRTSPFGSSGLLFGVAWGDGKFLAGGTSETTDNPVNTFMTSPDGITWTHVATAWDGYQVAQSVYWTGDEFIAGASELNYPNGDGTISSPDGVTFTVGTSTINSVLGFAVLAVPPTPPGPVYPLPVINIALTDPLSQFPEYVNITPWCKNADTSYGRQHELQQIEAQTIAANMDDITGLFSPWNFQSPFTNLLQYSDSVIPNTGGTNNWAAGTDTDITPSGGGLDPTLPALLVERTTSTGDASAAIGENGYVAVSEGTYYSGFASFLALTTNRNCKAGIAWYDSGLSLISTSSGTAVDDTAYTKATVTDVAPSGAVWASLVVTVESAASGEYHLACRFGVTQRFVDRLVSSGPLTLDVTAFGPGGYGLTAGKPVVLTASTDNVTIYPINFAYVESMVPTVVDELNKTVMLNCSDAFKFFANDVITSSLYPGVVMLDPDPDSIPPGQIQSPCLYWRLGDQVGTTLCADFSQNGNLGAAGGTPVFQQPGLIDQDADDSVFFPIGALFEISPLFNDAPTTLVTMEVWVALNAGSPGTTAFCATGPSPYLAMGVYGTGGDTGEPFWAAGGTAYAGIGGTITDGLPHHLVLTYDNASGLLNGYQDGVNVLVNQSVATGLLTGESSAIVINEDYPNGVNLDEFAVYPFALSGVQVATHFDIGAAGGGYTIPGGATTTDVLIEIFLLGAGFPLWMMSFEDGISEVVCPTITVGTTPLLDTVNQIVASEQGLLYQDRSGYFVFLNRHYALTASNATEVQATFENSPSSGLYYLPAGFQPTLDDADLWNDIPTQTSSGNPDSPTVGPLFDVQDLTSIAHFGKRTLQGYTSMLYADQDDTADLGEFLLSQYSVPITRIRSAQISSAANQGAALQQMFERDLFDLLAFIYHPQDAGEDFNESAQLEKVQHKITPGLWITTWQLNPYSLGAYSWFTIGDSVYGVLAGPGSDAANRVGF